MTTRALLARGAGALFGAMLLGRAIALIALLLLFRSLSPEDLGGYSILSTLQSALIALAGLGLPIALVRLHYDRRVNREEAWAAGQVLAWGSALVVAGSLVIGSSWVAALFHAPGVAGPLRIAGIAVAAQTLLAFTLARLQAAHRQPTVAAVNLLLAFMNSALVVWWGRAFGLPGVSWAWAASTVLMLGIATVVTGLPRLAFHRVAMRRVVTVATPYFVSVILNLVALALAKAEANRAVGLAALGSLAIGELLAQVLTFLPGAAGQAFLPAASDAQGSNPEVGRAATERLGRWLGLVVLPAALLGGLLVAPILQVLADVDATEAASAAVLFSGAVVLSALMSPVGTYLVSADRQTEGLAFNVAWAVAFVAATAWLAPRIGVVGYAWAYFLAFVVQFASVAPFARAKLSISLDWPLAALAVAGTLVGVSSTVWPATIRVPAAVAICVLLTGAAWWLRRSDFVTLWQVAVGALRSRSRPL